MSQNPYYTQYAAQQSQGYDVNPYHQPYQGPSLPGPSSSGPVPANAYEYDVGILAQQSVYVPGAMIDKRGGAGGKVAKGGKRTTVLRKGAGKVWEDQTLLEWDPSEHFVLGTPSNRIS
jgi:RNA-binding protein 42